MCGLRLTGVIMCVCACTWFTLVCACVQMDMKVVPSMLLYLEDTYSIDFTIVHFDKAWSLLLLWMYRKRRDWCTDDAVMGQVRHSPGQHLGCFTHSWLGEFHSIATIRLST